MDQRRFTLRSKSSWEKRVLSEVLSLKKYAKISLQNDNVNMIFERINDDNEKIQIDNAKETRPEKFYPSGSTYEGEWTQVGWEGQGVYKFPHGVIFEGQFEDTRFNGPGTLIYPMEQKLTGIWKNGRSISWKYKFTDNLEYVDPWTYCKFPDRRYFTSQTDDFCGPERERLTNVTPPRQIPKGCYDVGEGFYNPKTKCIVSAFDIEKIIRIPTKEEETWIQKNCRKAWDENVGYKPELYEYWTTGTAKSTEDILKKINKQSTVENESDDSLAGEA